MIGLIEAGPRGDGADAEAGAGGSASGFYHLVPAIEDGSLQGDAAKRSEGAETVCGHVVGEKIIVVGCREAEAVDRLVVRFTAEVFLVLEQTAATREAVTVTLIGETLHDSVFTPVHHREGRKEQTVFKLALEEEARADVLILGGDHEGSGISDASGTHENDKGSAPSLALHEQAASAHA